MTQPSRILCLVITLWCVAVTGCGRHSGHDAELDQRRALRYAELDARHAALAIDPTLIGNLAQTLDLTDQGRATVNEKLQVLQMRLDEAGNLIQGLKTAAATEVEARDTAATDAMHRLEAARAAAWAALDEAPRLEPAS